MSYSTYLGGSGGDAGLGIAVDAAGNAYVTGSTDSTNFPTTAGAFDTTLDGAGGAFAAKLNLATSPGLDLMLNQTAFRRGERLALTATVMPGPTPVTADVYVAVQLPDGTLLFLLGDGSFSLSLQPLVRSWPIGAFTGPCSPTPSVGENQRETTLGSRPSRSRAR